MEGLSAKETRLTDMDNSMGKGEERYKWDKW